MWSLLFDKSNSRDTDFASAEKLIFPSLFITVFNTKVSVSFLVSESNAQTPVPLLYVPDVVV